MGPPPRTSSAVPIVIVLIVVIFGGVFVLGIIAAIAIPGLLRARMSGNEASAIGTVRAMVSGQAVWASMHAGRYAQPSCLGDPASCGEPQMPSALPADIASLRPRSGYDFGFVLRPSSDDASTDATDPATEPSDPGGFAYWASPSTPGSTGSRRFCVDETGVVREYDLDDSWRTPTADQPRCPGSGRPLS
jgi:hypothetical protein